MGASRSGTTSTGTSVKSENSSAFWLSPSCRACQRMDTRSRVRSGRTICTGETSKHEGRARLLAHERPTRPDFMMRKRFFNPFTLIPDRSKTRLCHLPLRMGRKQHPKAVYTTSPLRSPDPAARHGKCPCTHTHAYCTDPGGLRTASNLSHTEFAAQVTARHVLKAEVAVPQHKPFVYLCTTATVREQCVC